MEKEQGKGGPRTHKQDYERVRPRQHKPLSGSTLLEREPPLTTRIQGSNIQGDLETAKA